MASALVIRIAQLMYALERLKLTPKYTPGAQEYDATIELTPTVHIQIDEEGFFSVVKEEGDSFEFSNPTYNIQEIINQVKKLTL